MSHSVRCWLSFYLEMLCLLAAKVLILFELYDEKVWSGPSKTLCTMQYGLFEMGNWKGEVKIQNCETKCKTVNDMITVPKTIAFIIAVMVTSLDLTRFYLSSNAKHGAYRYYNCVDWSLLNLTVQ